MNIPFAGTAFIENRFSFVLDLSMFDDGREVYENKQAILCFERVIIILMSPQLKIAALRNDIAHVHHSTVHSCTSQT